MLVVYAKKEEKMRSQILFFRGNSKKKPRLLALLFDVCVATGVILLIALGPSCSNTSDASEDAIEDIMHDDIQEEDVEIEPTGGTWTDPGSGLTWQNPPAESSMEWQDAMDYCEVLTLDGHVDWRLPTISELRSLLRGCPETETGGSCGVDDGCLSNSCWSDPCASCSSYGGPDDGCYRPVEAEGPCSWLWSSSSREDLDGWAWYVYFDNGSVHYDYKDDYYFYVRCVR